MKNLMTLLAFLISSETVFAQHAVNKSCDVSANGTLVDTKIILKSEGLYSVNPVFTKTKNADETTSSYSVLISVTKGILLVQVADRDQNVQVGTYKKARVIATASMEFDKIVDNEILGANLGLEGLQVRCYEPK